jgi:hypothetical protein
MQWRFNTTLRTFIELGISLGSIHSYPIGPMPNISANLSATESDPNSIGNQYDVGYPYSSNNVIAGPSVRISLLQILGRRRSMENHAFW